MGGITAIILMGGSGERFGSLLPKQFQRLGGKPVYLHTLEAILRPELFEEVVLVCPPNRLQEVEESLTDYAGKRARAVAGGATRQASSEAGIRACSPQTQAVLIHDGVR